MKRPRPPLWFNRTFICSFWGCKPPEGAWWSDERIIGRVARLPQKCERCGGEVGQHAKTR